MVKNASRGEATLPLQAATQGVDLGNIDMFKIDFGIKRKEHFGSRSGIQTLDRFDAYSKSTSLDLHLRRVRESYPCLRMGRNKERKLHPGRSHCAARSCSPSTTASKKARRSISGNTVCMTLR